MLATQKVNVLWIPDFESHQHANSLERVEALVNVIAQEDVLKGLHLPFIWVVEGLKESQKLGMLAINGPEDL